MYASVIPAVKMPRGFREFDYEIPDALLSTVKRGSLIEVPWRKSLVIGLVTAVSDRPSDSKFKLKPVERSLSDLLPEDFTALFEWLPDRTFSSPAQCLRAFLPSFTKKLLAQGLPEPAAPNHERRDNPNRRTQCYASPADKLERLLRTIESGPQGQTLVLAPHLSDVKAIAEFLRSQSGKNVVEVLGATTTKSYREAWLSALAGEAEIVIGTRSASTFPLPRLSSVIITESDSRDHRQYDQNPRYDAREVADWRAKQVGADLTVMSHAPRPEDLVAAEDAPDAHVAAPAEVTLVNVTKQEKFGSILSNSAWKRLDDALQRGEKVLIFHNRLGDSLAIFCRDCGQPLRCQKCEIALRHHGTKLRCHRCRDERPMPSTCPKCGGVDLKSFGAGSQKLAQRLSEKFPQAKIVRFDSEAESPAKLDADVIIGTQLAVHDLSELPGLADGIRTVIATDCDELISHPGFRTTEQAWRTVTTLRHLAGDGQLILETLDPESPRLRRLLEPPDKFLPDELKIRTDSRYPPASDLMTVTVADVSETAGRRELENLAAQLRAVSGNAGISRPLQPGQPHRHGKWRWVLAIRHAESSPQLLQTLARLPEKFLVERDPDSIT